MPQTTTQGNEKCIPRNCFWILNIASIKRSDGVAIRSKDMQGTKANARPLAMAGRYQRVQLKRHQPSFLMRQRSNGGELSRRHLLAGGLHHCQRARHFEIFGKISYFYLLGTVFVRMSLVCFINADTTMIHSVSRGSRPSPHIRLSVFARTIYLDNPEPSPEPSATHHAHPHPVWRSRR